MTILAWRLHSVAATKTSILAGGDNVILEADLGRRWVGGNLGPTKPTQESR